MCHLQLDVYDLRGIRRMRCCGHCFTFCGVFPLLWWCGWEAHPCTSPLCASYWDVPFCLAILPKDILHSHSAWRMYSVVFLFWCEPCEHTEEAREERHFKLAALWHIDQIYPVTSAGDTKRHLRGVLVEYNKHYVHTNKLAYTHASEIQIHLASGRLVMPE